ncbi:hypothetical protein CDAR_561721 [Caerostris darwini]|uniref:Uncharacterized protein n=1 Tax=Caerostris darwini TaxID=1538125 RepID=A0AAV4V6E5_9ARAC|nr:hypothetical protein CDAR_561721 [Caerostris darwini]
MLEELLYSYDDQLWNIGPDHLFMYRNIIVLKCYLFTCCLVTFILYLGYIFAPGCGDESPHSARHTPGTGGLDTPRSK